VSDAVQINSEQAVRIFAALRVESAVLPDETTVRWTFRGGVQLMLSTDDGTWWLAVAGV
jgi:hypothetical protein